jgi:hypothetical protein
MLEKLKIFRGYLFKTLILLLLFIIATSLNEISWRLSSIDNKLPSSFITPKVRIENSNEYEIETISTDIKTIRSYLAEILDNTNNRR